MTIDRPTHRSRRRRPPSRLYERHLRRRRLQRRLFLLVLLAATCAAVWPRVRRHPVFVVQVVRLVKCPDHLRPVAQATLQPLVGQTFFDARAQAPRLQAQLARLPEVLRAQLICRPPDTVEVSLLPRVPVLTVRVAGDWLSLDAQARILRVLDEAEPGLPQVFGLQPKVVTPGRTVDVPAFGQAVACVRAVRLVTGELPRAMQFEPGGGLRVRTAEGLLIKLGRPVQLTDKLQLVSQLTRHLPEAAAYIDVSEPAAVAWRPANAVYEPEAYRPVPGAAPGATPVGEADGPRGAGSGEPTAAADVTINTDAGHAGAPTTDETGTPAEAAETAEAVSNPYR